VPVAPLAHVSKIRPVHPPALANPETVLAEPIQPPALAAPVKPVAPIVPSEAVRPGQPKLSVVTPALVAQNKNIVTVRSGDSLWTLAQHTLGRGSRWPELLALNPSIANPNQIHIGARLHLPVVASANRAHDGQNDPISTIKVRRGDTLWSLAKSSLGRSTDWPCLASANPSVADPNRIFAGQGLIVPSACNAAASYSPSHAKP